MLQHATGESGTPWFARPCHRKDLALCCNKGIAELCGRPFWEILRVFFCFPWIPRSHAWMGDMQLWRTPFFSTASPTAQTQHLLGFEVRSVRTALDRARGKEGALCDAWLGLMKGEGGQPANHGFRWTPQTLPDTSGKGLTTPWQPWHEARIVQWISRVFQRDLGSEHCGMTWGSWFTPRDNKHGVWSHLRMVHRKTSQTISTEDCGVWVNLQHLRHVVMFKGSWSIVHYCSVFRVLPQTSHLFPLFFLQISTNGPTAAPWWRYRACHLPMRS